MIFFSPANESCDRRGPGQDVRIGQEPFNHRPHGLSAESPRLLAPAAIEHAIGENVPPLEIGAELDLVDGEESDVEIAGHRLERGDPVARIRWLDLLLAGDERDRIGASSLGHLVVHLTRQEAQRQAYDAGRMAQHTLDREMGLAGIGRTEHGSNSRATSASIAIGP